MVLRPNNLKPRVVRRRRRAIIDFCLWCCNGQRPEVKDCPSTDCSLYPVRLRGLSSKGLSLKKIIKAKCLNCRPDSHFVSTCNEVDCKLHCCLVRKPLESDNDR